MRERIKDEGNTTKRGIGKQRWKITYTCIGGKESGRERRQRDKKKRKRRDRDKGNT
jgi:hypothetical protein